MRFSDLLPTTFLITKRSGVTPSRDLSNLKDDVDFFVSLFEGAGFPVYLGGGVGLALRAGYFYRNHEDFDIMVFVENLPMLVRHPAGRGYLVAKRSFMVHLSSEYRLESLAPFDLSLLKRSD